jgi:hypothetical protein
VLINNVHRMCSFSSLTKRSDIKRPETADSSIRRNKIVIIEPSRQTDAIYNQIERCLRLRSDDSNDVSNEPHYYRIIWLE